MEITKQIKTVGIIGHFAEGLDMADGQVVKTRTVRELLRDVCGNENVRSVDTRGWQKHPISLIRECTELAKFSDVLIMLPAHNGLKVFAPMLISLRKRHGCKVAYSVIGGFLLSLNVLKLCSPIKASKTCSSHITTSACRFSNSPNSRSHPVSHGL